MTLITTNIPSRFHSVANDHVVAGADEIFDDTLNKRQSTINATIPTKITDLETVRIVNVNANLTNQTTNVDAGHGETVIFKNTGSAKYTIGISSSYLTPDGQAMTLTCPVGGYCECSFLNIDGIIYARGV